MLRKRLVLILATLVTVSAVILGTLILSTRAAVTDEDTYYPPAAGGNYYGSPGAVDANDDSYTQPKYFGPEIFSNTLCSGDSTYNHGFDITYTRETANLSLESSNSVKWTRDQIWRFGTDPPTPWGGYTFTITRNAVKNLHTGVMTTPSVIFPWTGSEIHQRNGDIIVVWSEITGWVNATAIAGWDVLLNSDDPPSGVWVCPDYYKKIGYGTPTYDYDCNAGSPDWDEDWIEHRYTAFNDVERHNGGYAREAPVESGTYYNCMRLD